MTTNYHTSVFTKELIEFLNCKPDGIYVDVTLGGGGWAEEILEASGPKGRVIGFDRDRDAITEAEKRLAKFAGRFQLIKAKFSKVVSELDRLGINSVDGVVADLGVSSYQLNTAERGFSFVKDSPLDMRMGEEDGLTAMDIVNTESEKQLADWFFEFGEERFSRRIARAIVKERMKHPISTTGELAEIVSRASRGGAGRRIHPATRVFQALRIVVNDEIGELKSLLGSLPPFLGSGGRMIVVSYHSLEDRLVKRKFLELAGVGEYKRVTKKPVRPQEEEIMRNRRARSAKMRVLERI